MSEKTEASGIQDSVVAELKGPDPDEWGPDEERPAATFVESGLAIGEIQNEGTPEEVKGPGEAWAKDDEGEYVNR